ncbi:ABC transporter substrate-binding protein [Streptomyces uncialis]|uniref:ABC transporter substrate-binding protein n=1 Tax=Streptomyces uncialis TaxID=1048205 RepID=UPI00225B9367|nr:ABC transporter substrate-binding protein [Streptomyces uncialis]MCX4661871.1 ABC transporter substrate-binding protein [Streptomyces uncialis]WTE09142.1 ABC transporter substrate-binding protein [Streptomyces uncialis]
MLYTVTGRRAARATAAFAVAVLFLTACGSGSGGGGGDSTGGGPGEVTLAGAYGRTTVPVTDEKVWALDPRTATELLAIGVTPTHVGRSTHKGDAAFQAQERLLADEGIELVEPDKVELVLEAGPSVIIGEQSLSSDELAEELKKIAPVLITRATASWEENLRLLGRATGRGERAGSVIEHLDRETTATRRDIEEAGLAGETVSLMSACGEGNFCAYGSGRTAGPVLTDLGFKRPSAHGQDRTGVTYGYTSVSEEKLGELVAPIVFVLSGSVQYGAPDPLDNPLFEVGDARTGVVDFAAWYGSGSFDVSWVLNDIRAVLLDDGTVTDQVSGVELFEELRKAGA